MTILELKNLKVYYQTLKGNVKAMDGINLEIQQGEIIGLAGESGCGKTTLGKSLINLKKPMKYISGDLKLRSTSLVNLGERKMNKIRFKDISLIPQSAMNSFSPTQKIRTFILDLLKERDIPADAAFFEKVEQRLSMVNLDSSVLDQYPIELSGGMKQRLIIVISTLLDPDLLIADEITSALDVTSQRFVAQILEDFKNKNIIGSIIFITHDLSILSQIANRIAIMYAGKIVEVAPTETLISSPKHPYTKAFLGALPQIGTRFKQKALAGIEGTPPLLLEIKEGCRFRFRCAHAKEICGQVSPATDRLNQDHSVACHFWKEINEEIEEMII